MPFLMLFLMMAALGLWVAAQPAQPRSLRIRVDHKDTDGRAPSQKGQN